MWHLRYSRIHRKIHSKHSKCCWCRYCCVFILLELKDSQNLQFIHLVLLIYFPGIVGRASSSRLSQFIRSYLHLPKFLHTVLHHFGDCAHHAAEFIIITLWPSTASFHHRPHHPHSDHRRNWQDRLYRLR